MNTSLLQYTPSNSINTCFPFSLSRRVKVLRYQPKPPGNAPPPVPAGWSLLKLPSMLQSCGNCSVRHDASSTAGSLKAAVLSSLNFQSALNDFRPLCCADECRK